MPDVDLVNRHPVLQSMCTTSKRGWTCTIPEKAERRERVTAINCVAVYRHTFDQYDDGLDALY
jgi:hypothetical protein